jgi:acyl-CoA dehydrogenase
MHARVKNRVIARPFADLLAQTKSIARQTASVHAASVDANARFPRESFEALKAARLLSAPVPRELGGDGLSLQELGQICSALAEGCGSSGMVLAMHYIQVACIARHGLGSPFFRRFLTDLVACQYLLGSVTSEVGTFGDTRSSICAIEVKGESYRLVKEATTVSYGEACDALLLTCRRSADAPASDQILVLARKGEYDLKQTTNWDTMGMRGTCSPGYVVTCEVSPEQVVPAPYADISAHSMVPYSHILWSALWQGIAADAVARAAAMVRGEARKRPGTVPPTALRLAEVIADLQAVRNNWQGVARDFDEIEARPGGDENLAGMGWALRLNGLKTTCSDAAPRIVHKALQITGILGYKNDTPFSLGRHYRDVLSASLMISNERIAAKSASMLLVLKEDQ